MSILPDRQEELRSCYDEQASHFVETRKKNRPEFLHLQEQVKQFAKNKGSIQVTELGCGGGRLYVELKDHFPAGSHYTGVDFASSMIVYAKQCAPEAEWMTSDMLVYLHEQPQESIDLILGVASIQHIKGAKQRALFFAHAYKSLSRGGVLLLTNRAYSDWFLKKYRKNILMTAPRMLLDHELTRNDVIIPRKDHTDPTHQWSRYYHLFTLYELQQLARHAGFVVRICKYVAQDGLLTDNRRNARNSFLVLQKEVA